MPTERGGEVNRREDEARRLYSGWLYGQGYTATRNEGMTWWDVADRKTKARFRRAADVSLRAVDDAMREVRRVAIEIPDPSRALTTGASR